MKTKLIIWAVMLLIVLFAAGCSAQPEKEPLESMEAAVLDNQDGVLTVAKAGDGADLYTVSIGEASVFDQEDEAALTDIESGMLILIEYAGPMAQSYPTQILNCQVVRIIGTADEADLAAAGEALSALADQFADLSGQLVSEQDEDESGPEPSEDASEDDAESEAEASQQESAGTSAAANQAASVQPESSASSPPAQSQAPAATQDASSSTSDSSTGTGGYSFNLPTVDPLENNPDRGNYELAQEMLDYIRTYAESQGITWDSSVSRTSFDIDNFVGQQDWQQGMRNQIDRYVELGDVHRIWGEILERSDGTLTIRIYR